MIRHSLNIVATCTKRKTVLAPARLSLGRIRHSDPKSRSAAWIDSLAKPTEPAISASNLYCGDQWQVVRSLLQVGSQHDIDVNLWVCSAGYGLIHADSMIQPYSATFSLNHPDSVCRTRLVNRTAIHTEWWRWLTRWEGPQPEQPRSLTQLAEHFSSRPLIVVASPAYLDALQDDLLEARKRLRTSNLLAIISSGAERLASLDKNKIPCDARLQHALGGALMSLNPRIAREVLKWLGLNEWNLTALKSHFARKLARQPDRPRYERLQMSDEDVCYFVLQESTRHPAPSASSLLRILRDSGFACEQKRFSKLFLKIKESQNG